MTRKKSLRPNGIETGPGADPSGYVHRVHRSKKNRKPKVRLKKGVKAVLEYKNRRFEREQERRLRKVI